MNQKFKLSKNEDVHENNQLLTTKMYFRNKPRIMKRK